MKTLKTKDFIKQLPYSPPFLFVDEIVSVTDEGIMGTYTFDPNSYFYEGHFKNNPITPGVILTECMGQIGLVCMGIFLLKEEGAKDNTTFALSNTDIDFFTAVLPGEIVTVISEKVYFRFNKLKCKVKMLNGKEKVVAQGTMSGMIVKNIKLQ